MGTLGAELQMLSAAQPRTDSCCRGQQGAGPEGPGGQAALLHKDRAGQCELSCTLHAVPWPLLACSMLRFAGRRSSPPSLSMHTFAPHAQQVTLHTLERSRRKKAAAPFKPHRAWIAATTDFC